MAMYIAIDSYMTLLLLGDRRVFRKVRIFSYVRQEGANKTVRW